MGRVDGKVALITGGARGMGAAHARMLVGEGAKVESVITDKSVVVKSGRTLCGAPTFPVYIGKGIVI